ncbi:MAG: hypothetical protein HUU55_03020 [Myxococcales bacterium]|nr:hypothetical protein [Myxococcales bacterium]
MRYYYTISMAVGLMMPAVSTSAECLPIPGDVDQSGAATVVDVQCQLVSVLAILNNAPTPGCLAVGFDNADLNCDGDLSVVDVQLTIQLVLGQTLDPVIDANANLCVDACEPQGLACLNTADLAAMSNVNTGVIGSNCGVSCLFAGDPAACTATCVQNQTGVSGACASCFGDLVACTIDNCVSACATNPSSSNCFVCQANAGCTEAFNQCAGIPANGLPPTNACTNADDKTAAALSDVYTAMPECISACAGKLNVGVCIMGCFAMDTGISATCSLCYYGAATCGQTAGCSTSCAAAWDTYACETCMALGGCMTAFATCAGHALYPAGWGKCINEADLASLGSVNIVSSLTVCATQCVFNPNPTACAANCFSNTVGTSANCTGCFSSALSCGTTLCFNACLGGLTSQTCKNCLTNQGCAANFETCAGIPFPL